MFYDFRIPGVQETEETIRQSNAIRIIPWFVILQEIIDTGVIIIRSLTSNYEEFHTIKSTSISQLFFSAIAIYFMFFLAQQIKKGNIAAIRFVKFLTILGLILILFTTLLVNIVLVGSSSQAIFDTPFMVVYTAIRVLVYCYILFGLIKFGKQIVADGKSFSK